MKETKVAGRTVSTFPLFEDRATCADLISTVLVQCLRGLCEVEEKENEENEDKEWE